jgi:hypothetical protein
VFLALVSLRIVVTDQNNIDFLFFGKARGQTMSSTSDYPMNFAVTPLGQRKVAIPRLQRVGQGQSATKDKRRVSRACTAVCCHSLKITTLVHFTYICRIRARRDHPISPS